MTKRLILVSVFTASLWTTVSLNAQALSVTDKSAAHAARIRSSISNNREIVQYIEYTLVSRGLPRHLRNLSLLESSFVNSSVSHAGAVGIWQIMPAHAQDHGLSQEDRADIYRSTQAAANSLTKLYNKYRDWITVLAAYNCGEGNVAKAMAKAGSQYYEDYYPYLPDETINSIRKYINACYVTGELDELLRGTRQKKTAQPRAKNVPMKRTVPLAKNDEKKNTALMHTQINNGYSLRVIENILDISSDQLRKWNPNLTEELNRLPDVTLHLPPDKMGVFEANRHKILKLSITH